MGRVVASASAGAKPGPCWHSVAAKRSLCRNSHRPPLIILRRLGCQICPRHSDLATVQERARPSCIRVVQSSSEDIFVLVNVDSESGPRTSCTEEACVGNLSLNDFMMHISYPISEWLARLTFLMLSGWLGCRYPSADLGVDNLRKHHLVCALHNLIIWRGPTGWVICECSLPFTRPCAAQPYSEAWRNLWHPRLCIGLVNL